MSYTQGKWEATFDEGNDFIIICKDYTICSSNVSEKRPDEKKSNARLIASAPELLETLKGALGQLYSNLGDLTDHFEQKHTRAMIDTIEEEIQKAEVK